MNAGNTDLDFLFDGITELYEGSILDDLDFEDEVEDDWDIDDDDYDVNEDQWDEGDDFEDLFDHDLDWDIDMLDNEI